MICRYYLPVACASLLATEKIAGSNWGSQVHCNGLWAANDRQALWRKSPVQSTCALCVRKVVGLSDKCPSHRFIYLHMYLASIIRNLLSVSSPSLSFFSIALENRSSTRPRRVCPYYYFCSVPLSIAFYINGNRPFSKSSIYFWNDVDGCGC